MKIVIVGGGAAGFFAAANLSEKLKSKNPEIIILEKTSKVLAKVKISGGGRCNVSNANSKLSELLENYPRGAKELRKVFKSFSVTETVEWFQKRGVKLKTEDDGRMFPITNSSQTIINCLENSCEKGEVRIILNSEVKSISRKLESIEVNCIEKSFQCDYLIVTTGGFPKTSGYSFLESTGHTIIEPAPSLFTFNLKDKTLTKLMGVSVHLANVKISGTKLQYAGPLLITHWGISGPAVLKLSAFGAILMKETGYKNRVIINWVNAKNEEEVRLKIKETIELKPRSLPLNTNIYSLAERLWKFLLFKSGVDITKNWSEQTAKSINRLVNIIFSDFYETEGKTTFKEEFVTCGGVDINEVNFESMESKLFKGLYFAGEVLNMDGITGGFNFQAAWSTAWLVANSITEKVNS